MASITQPDSVLLMCSSPPRHTRSFNLSSSPLPSPSELFGRKRPVLRTGSNAMPIPEDKCASFTSALTFSKNLSLGITSSADTVRLFSTGKHIYDVPGEGPASPMRKTRVITTNGLTNDKTTKAVRTRKVAAKTIVVGADCTMVKETPKLRPKAVSQVEADEVLKAAKDINSEKDAENEIRPACKPVRKPRANNMEKTQVDGKMVKSKTVRKPRAKKGIEIHTKLPLAKVTKLYSHTKDDTNEHTSCDEPVSVPAESLAPHQDDLDLGLIEAVKRRNSWTPPRPSRGRITGGSTTEPGLQATTEAVLSGSEDSPRPQSTVFHNLVENFGFISSNDLNVVNSVTNRTLSEARGFKKRKLVELPSIPTLAAARSTSPTKIRKKARTLTGLAISPYVLEAEPSVAPFPEHFAVKTTVRVDQVTKDEFKIPRKPRSKSPVKRSKKGNAQPPTLLSPESALKRTTAQDFVFGTSSQLAREDSPSYLKDLHAAMQASNELRDPDTVETLFGNSHEEIFIELGDQTYDTSRIKTPARRQCLWSAASRDRAGDLSGIEIVDMVNTPTLIAQEKPNIEQQIPFYAPGDIADVLSDIDVVDKTPSFTHSSSEITKTNEIMMSEQACSLQKKNASPKPPKQVKPSKKTLSKQAVASSQTQMPIFESYTDIQLRRAIAANGFKAIKNRAQMITLLKKCWDSEQERNGLESSGINSIMGSTSMDQSEALMRGVAPPSSQNIPPKKPKGRPKKDKMVALSKKPRSTSKVKASSTIENLEMDSDTPLSHIRTPPKKKGKITAEEISDSEDTLTPSPPRSCQTRRPLPLKPSDDTSDLPDLSSLTSQIYLFSHITNAVVGVKPSKDPKNPTWHEKILLFDPIVLEDLTVWLNSEGFRQAGWDGEVEPKEVKRWCESKSICCLWKENLRGGARNRY